MNAKPHIAIPEPTSFDPAYNQRGWPQYARAVELSGGIAVPGSPADLDPQKFNQERHLESAKPDAAREAVDDLLLQDAFNLHKPILGICYGLQSLNVWRNGALDQHIPGTGVDHAPGRDVLCAHPVKVVEGSHLAQILGSRLTEDAGQVNSSHHQAVLVPGDALAVVATSQPDGIIEALEGVTGEQFVLGVQWHPERSFSQHASSKAIFKAFIEAAASWKVRPILESVGN